jgi:hypothetical protein
VEVRGPGNAEVSPEVEAFARELAEAAQAPQSLAQGMPKLWPRESSFGAPTAAKAAMGYLATCPFRFYVRHLLRPRRGREAEDGDRAEGVLRRLLGLLGAEAGPG